MANSATAPEDVTGIQLNDDDVAYLMNLLRNATLPATTQQLLDALRRQANIDGDIDGAPTFDAS